MRTRTLVCLALLIALCPLTTSARTIAVPSPEASSIPAALAKAQSGDTVLLENGIYHVNLMMSPGVTLKARSLFGAVIDGKGRRATVTMASNTTIAGLEIRNGTVGVECKSAGARIEMCRIVRNLQSGILSVGHLPDIHDNIIAFNKGSGMQGWDLRATTSSLSHNTIAFNGNHGVSVGGNSDVILENCIVSNNAQFGVKVDGSARVRLNTNDFYENPAGTEMLSADNISEDPHFVDAHALDFSLSAGSRCIGYGSDRQDLGARITQTK
jgi:parallel beta-helix repeat protein